MAKVNEILNYLENNHQVVKRQYDWDNSSRQLYTGDRDIKKLALALDPSENVINQSIKEGCEVLITHHPLFFGKLKQIDSRTFMGRKVLTALQNKLDIASYHTSLDLADYSLNDYLPELLGATVIDTLQTEGKEEFYKFAVFVPVDYAEKIVEVIEESDGGSIGNYSGCTFRAEGKGTFRPNDESNPFIGEKGELATVDEFRVETIIPASKLQNLIRSVVEAHPYEEVAYDVYRLEKGEEWGIGRIAELDDEISLEAFLQLVSEKLGTEVLRHNSDDLALSFNKFAVLTGSGASMWKSCLKKGVNVYITGDMKHHEALDAAEAGVCIIDAGHYFTEKIFMDYLAKILSEKFDVETLIIDEKPAIKDWRK